MSVEMRGLLVVVIVDRLVGFLVLMDLPHMPIQEALRDERLAALLALAHRIA